MTKNNLSFSIKLLRFVQEFLQNLIKFLFTSATFHFYSMHLFLKSKRIS